MEVIKKGRPQKGWSIKKTCTGSGNGGGGCGAKLLVSEFDIYETSRTFLDGSGESYRTFTCPECGVETDLTVAEVGSVWSRTGREKPRRASTTPSST